VTHENILPLWDIAASSLQYADRVVITGYSCPPMDLEARILLSENLRLNSEKRVYVIDPSTENAAKFVKLCGVDHTTIFNSIGDWVDYSGQNPTCGLSQSPFGLLRTCHCTPQSRSVSPNRNWSVPCHAA